ncbi:MAG: AarF/UbiB family protein [Gemmatimonadaceae bacterium]
MHALSVLWRLVPFIVAFLRDRKRWIVVGRPRIVPADHHRRRAQRLTATIAALGPTFIKLAQVFAARADILPEPYLSEIGSLTDRVPPLPLAAITGVIEQEFGQTPAQLFERFDPEPLAAASLGQVHRATTREGRDVVVKVLRPGAEAQVAIDLDAAFRILFVLNVLFPNHHVHAITTIVREFSKRIDEEMDFREEARNAQLIRANFVGDSRVRVPEVIDQYTKRRVLVLEYMEGTKIDRLQERIAAGDVSAASLVETLMEVYVKMMLVDGIFHADPHPGNILVAPDGGVVLLDFGMVVRVEETTRSRLIQTVMAAARQDVDGVIAGFYELGIIDPEVDRGTVRDAARSLMAIAFARESKPKQMQRIVDEVLSTFYRWPVTLPSELVYFGRAAALVEGIGVRYISDFNSVTFGTPIITRMRGQLLSAVLGAESKDVLKDWMTELAYVAGELRDVLRRAGRDELRVRAHPRDMMELQGYLARQTRRIVLCMFAGNIALVAAIFYLQHRNVYVLAASLFVSLIFFLMMLLIPLHLLSNPFRGYRRWR